MQCVVGLWGLTALRVQHFAGTTRPVFSGAVKAGAGDFLKVICCRYVVFVEPPPPVLAAGVAAGPSEGASGSTAAIGAPAGRFSVGPPVVGVAAPAGLEPWRGRLRRAVPGFA